MTGRPPAPDDLDELALTRAGFPQFRLWRTTIVGRTHFIAQAASLDTHPHTVVTDDLAELRAVLTAGQQPPAR